MEKRGLPGLSVKPCGCFPSSAVSPPAELLRLVSCRGGIACPDRPVDCPLLSVGGARAVTSVRPPEDLD